MRRSFLVVLLAGCNALSGVDDLTADLDDGVDSPDRQPREDGGASSSGGPNTNADGGLNPGDGSTNPPLDGNGGPDSATGTRIRNITFEDKKLVHATSGFDSVFGSPQLLSSGALAGFHSMAVDGTGAFGTVAFGAVDDLYLTMRLRIDPASPNTGGDARILRITHAGATPIEAYVSASPRDLVVVQGANVLGSFAAVLTDGTVYRFEMRVRSSGSVTIRLVKGGSTASASGSGTVGASSKVEVGALSGGTIQAAFDDILLDSAVQP